MEEQALPLYGHLLDAGIWRQPAIPRVLGRRLQVFAAATQLPPTAMIVGWGRKPSGRRAEAIARRHSRALCLLEDGFLRSFGTGRQSPPLSLVVDDTGIYYDSTRPCALESLLNADTDLLAGIEGDVARARTLILEHRLSKYNNAPDWTPDARPAGARRILVVDQTAGDLSIALGGAGPERFAEMLAAARAEHPGATIYVKTHPEVTAGAKGGYLTGVQDDATTVLLRTPLNPLSLIEHMDAVYVVTSTMGFEALLAGKPVHCFGRPWYAGWGVTHDRQPLERRTRQRSVEELFAAAYFHYARYLDPVTHRPGTIFDVIGWLALQRQAAARSRGRASPGQGTRRLICVGMRRWKAANLQPLLSLDRDQLHFVHDAAAAAALRPTSADRLLHWGAEPPPGVGALAERSGARTVRLEDGFIRSVGLGSDLIRPQSLVMDETGIYFDPSRPSDLERLLQTAEFTREELQRAQAVRQFIVGHGITKYNVEPRAAARWPTQGRRVVLVPGQVEDDASIRLGCIDVRTNLGLLAAARRALPDAFIVYKPHPDVASGNRIGDPGMHAVRQQADLIETHLSVISCIEACDEVHTMTSLTGFDALLRGKRVVVHGQPFYAGWGLTHDMAQEAPAFERRTRRLHLDELVAGTLLRYPLYWDWELQGYTRCEAVLHRILAQREALETAGGIEKLRSGHARRQWRKAQALARAWLCRW